jgi:hypothetical protein
MRILSISDDDGLRYSRELPLLNAGYDAESVTSHTALAIGRIRSFDAAVICRSVEPASAAALTEMLRRYNPAMPIMNVALIDNIERLDRNLFIVSEPELFLEALREPLHSSAGYCREIDLR